MKYNKFFSLFILVFLFSCGPVYRTDYNYTPPRTTHGMQCTSGCQTTRQQCELIEDQRHDNCKIKAELEFFRCEHNKRFRFNQKTGERECIRNCNCFRPFCSNPSKERCDRQYRSCYMNCGGKVTSNTYCVSNCEKASESN